MKMKMQSEKEEPTKIDKKETVVCGAFKYQKLKPITFEEIFNYTRIRKVCCEFTEEFKFIIDKYSSDFGKLPFSKIINICDQQNTDWLEWLEENLFISKTAAIEIHEGDIFTIDNVKYMVCMDSNYAFLVSLETGFQDFSNVDYGDTIDEEFLYTLFNTTDSSELAEIIKSRIPSGSYKLKIIKNKKGRKRK